MRCALSVIVVWAAGLLGGPAAWAGSIGRDACAEPAEDAPAPTAEESWARLQHCLDDPRTDVAFAEHVWTPGTHPCGESARQVVITGDDRARERMWSLFDGLPDESPLGMDVLDAFLDWHVGQALRGLEASPAAPVVARPAPAAEMPRHLEEAPPDLQQAWRVFQSVVEEGEDESDLPAAGPPIPFRSNQPRFRRAVAALLRGRVSATDTVGELARFQGSGGCSRGSFPLDGPRSKALLIAYLRLGRADLALAARGGGLSLPVAGAADVRWDPRLLGAAGIDWEAFHLGGLLAGELELAEPLARQGSERAARQLLAATRLFDAAGRAEGLSLTPLLLGPMGAVVASSGACPGAEAFGARELQRGCEAPALGGAIQEDALDFLAEQVEPGAGLREAQVASSLLVQLCRPESRPAFRAMFASSYGEVRAKGAIGLRGLGDTVADPHPALPAAFRIVVDGRPVAERTVRWNLHTDGPEDESGSAESDAEGVVHLPRDPFVDPRRAVHSVELAAPDLAAPQDVWFSASVEPPADLAALTTVSVRTGALTVRVPPALRHGRDTAPLTLHLLAEVSLAGLDGFMTSASVELPVASGRITFPRLQHGRYQVWLRRGDQVYGSSPAEVGARPATLTVNERSLAEEAADWRPDPEGEP
jgi:hypothetical protein